MLAIAGAVIVLGGYSALTQPISESAIEHHDANPLLSMKAYDSGAAFYVFNRCRMFIAVDGKRFFFPGDEQNGECTFANPADAFKMMAFTRAPGDQ
jgi:hypothetical protein